MGYVVVGGICFFVGGFFGLTTMACCSVAGRADEQAGIK